MADQHVPAAGSEGPFVVSIIPPERRGNAATNRHSLPARRPAPGPPPTRNLKMWTREPVEPASMTTCKHSRPSNRLLLHLGLIFLPPSSSPPFPARSCASLRHPQRLRARPPARPTAYFSPAAPASSPALPKGSVARLNSMGTSPPRGMSTSTARMSSTGTAATQATPRYLRAAGAGASVVPGSGRGAPAAAGPPASAPGPAQRPWSCTPCTGPVAHLQRSPSRVSLLYLLPILLRCESDS